VDEIARRPAPEIVVIGHTDRVGAVPYNDALSLRRAERVRDELVKVGITADRISVAGRGEREPLVPTPDEVAEPRNRRVEINVR
jgi:outer membrane protein OmpA-like peptidoglycan-associated protein